MLLLLLTTGAQASACVEALRVTGDATGVQSCMAASADDKARAQCFSRLAPAAVAHAPSLAADQEESAPENAPRILQEESPFFDSFARENAL